jgi:hypothetical protein
LLVLASLALVTPAAVGAGSRDTGVVTITVNVPPILEVFTPFGTAFQVPPFSAGDVDVEGKGQIASLPFVLRGNVPGKLDAIAVDLAGDPLDGIAIDLLFEDGGSPDVYYDPRHGSISGKAIVRLSGAPASVGAMENGRARIVFRPVAFH